MHPYADLTPSLERDIKAGFVRVKTKETEWPAKAEVRVARFFESKVKLYLTLPFFPASVITSREMDLLLEAGERSGVSVPESAVLLREGRLGVCFWPTATWSISGPSGGFPLKAGVFSLQRG